MDFAFGHSDPLKYRNRFLLYPRREGAVIDQFLYLGKIPAVPMVVFVFISMMMISMFVIVVIMMRAMRVVMRV